MFTKQNIIGAIAVLALIVAGIGLVGGNSAKLGGTTNFDTLDVSDGYKVDGRTVISSSGNCLQLYYSSGSVYFNLTPTATGSATWAAGACS
jgi:hypothetical protein